MIYTDITPILLTCNSLETKQVRQEHFTTKTLLNKMMIEKNYILFLYLCI